MNHEKAQSLLSEFLENRLATDQRAELKQHLAQCASCTAHLKKLQDAIRLMGSMSPVEVPADLPARIRRRARKAGLFDRRRRRSAYRMGVPFESTLVVLLATMGALIFSLLLFHGQMKTVTAPHPPAVVLAASVVQVNHLARLAWDLDGQVHIVGKEVPPGSPLGLPDEMDLGIAPQRWPEFRNQLQKICPTAGLSAKAPLPGADGLCLVLIQIRLAGPA